ncbi:hypothetical protein I316_02627 [Kwoniella heveanensis BCC8398]|uniref:Metallo-beta-lactamase domain-containing protein n=1 Tax=Kwoniella heveanensis BCC8398 TaxID=1296120 RepID=A0A1B9GX16_9TREE|nr:hypothetical protein I316_02627 [Kwoniella heveanensis BCC8398]
MIPSGIWKVGSVSLVEFVALELLAYWVIVQLPYIQRWETVNNESTMLAALRALPSGLAAFAPAFFLPGDLDTLPQPAPPIVLGPGSLESIGPGYPVDPNAAWPAKWIEKYTFIELPSRDTQGDWTDEIASLGNPSGGKRRWEKMACFDHAIDWYGDGSLWFIDGPGHSPGHIMALCRVTAKPETLPTSESEDLRSPIPVVDGKPQLAVDPELATYTIGQLTRMSRENNVMVILAHEAQVDGVVDKFPESLNDWRSKGWKEKKEKEVTEAARKRGVPHF